MNRTAIDHENVHPRVLVVDDTPSNLLALSAILEPLDCEVVEARSGPAALQQAEHDADFAPRHGSSPGCATVSGTESTS